MPRPCKDYTDAPNPTPKPRTVMKWALTDQRGRFKLWLSPKVPRLHDKKPEGVIEHRGGRPIIWKPRRVRVTVEAI